MMQIKNKLSIIIPIYNELNSLPEILRLIARVVIPIEHELIFVDSGSTDGTTEFLKNLSVDNAHKFIFINRRIGKGAAVREGLKVSTGNIVMIQDADLEYDPSDYQRVLDPILSGKSQFVLGSRVLGAGTWRFRKSSTNRTYMFVLNLGSELLTRLFCLLYKVKVTDPQTMYKVFFKKNINIETLECGQFDLDWEILCKHIQRKVYPTEVPVSYQARTVQEGKKIRILPDSWNALRAILKYRPSSILNPTL